MLTVLTGRSRRLLPKVIEEIGEAYAAGAENILLITPDQYTLQAELDLIDQLNLPGLLGIEVLSPSRLLTRVFALAGSPQRVRIDERGRMMMLSLALKASKKELQYYARAVERHGFTKLLASTIAELKRAGMQPGDLAALAEGLAQDDALRGKLKDLSMLFERYEQRLEGAFLDGEDVQEALLERMPQSEIMRGARIWIYGFDLISPQFLRQIALMSELSASVCLALTLDSEKARDSLVFAPARQTLSRLSKYFDASHMAWEHRHLDSPLNSTQEINHLEQELFAIPIRPYPQAPSSITLWAANNPYDEAMLAAAALMVYARGGVPLEEIRIVAGDMEAYAGPIEAAFARSGIPYHISQKRPAIAHPLMRAVLSALRCVTRRWRAEDALDWMKGGFCGLTRDEMERLENYAIENGLRGAKWRKPVEDIELEALRARFAQPLEALQAALRQATCAAEMLAAIYGLLEAVDAYQTLDAWQQQLLADGLFTEAADCTQAWRLLMETLDQLYTLLSDSSVPAADLVQSIEAGLSEAELGAIPASPGVVQAGQLGHMKIGSACRVLFLLGLQDGILQSNESMLLSEEEAARTTELSGQHATLGLHGDALSQLMQMNLLDTIAAPTQRLFMSHSMSSASGEAQRPAAVLRLLRRVFPGLVEKNKTTEDLATWHAPGPALDAMGAALAAAAESGKPLDDLAHAAMHWLLHSKKTRLKAEQILRMFASRPMDDPLPKQTANALYAHMRTSISRLEAFAHCPYRHFVAYGLRPIPRREFIVARNETGTFYHRAMEEYARAAKTDAAWPNVSREENDALMDGVLQPLKAEWENAPLGDNAMLQAMGDAFCRVARRAAWNYAGQMRRGKFTPDIIEARFGPGEALPPIALRRADGQRVWLGGRIDRIDFYRESDLQWLRVVDYKSGSASLDPSRIHAGLQLQLLLYLSAAIHAFPEVQAAGMFYSSFDDPYVETDQRDLAFIEREIAKKLQLQGIALSDVRVIRAMDNGEAMITKDGAVSKRAGTLPAEDLDALMHYATLLATQMLDRIAEGEIAPRPAQLQGWKACTWCDCRESCAFDATLPGYSPKRLEKLTRDELVEKATALRSEGRHDDVAGR